MSRGKMEFSDFFEIFLDPPDNFGVCHPFYYLGSELRAPPEPSGVPEEMFAELPNPILFTPGIDHHPEMAEDRFFFLFQRGRLGNHPLGEL